MKKNLLKIMLIVAIFLMFFILVNSCNAMTIHNTKYTMGDGIIYRIMPKTSIENFLSVFTIEDEGTNNIEVRNQGNDIPKTSGYVATGDYAVFSTSSTVGDVLNSESWPYMLSVVGDITRDGETDQRDLSDLIRYFIGNTNYNITEEARLKSADVNGDNTVDIRDISNEISYIVTGRESYLGENNSTPIVVPGVDTYQLSLTLRYYENITENSGSTPSGVSELSPLEYMEYPESTIVAIDGETYDLTDATLITVENGDSTWRTAEKTYTLNVNSGSIIAVTTDGGKDITWNYNNSELSESRAAYLQMPNKNTSITIENKKYDTYTDNNIREITGDIVTNPTGVKDLTLRLNDYGTNYWYSSMYANTFVSVDGIRYDTGDATVDPDKGMASKEYTIKVKPGAIISVLGYNIVQDGDSSHAEEISWKVKGQNICTADGISFKMPDKNATLEISNGKDSEGAADNSIRNITGDFDTNILDGTRVLDLELVRYIDVDGDILLSVSDTCTLVNVNGMKLDLNNDTYTTEKVKISNTKSKNVGVLTRTYKFYFQPEGSIKITANKETSNQAGFGMERNKNCRWYYNDNSIGNFDSKAQVSSKLVNRDIQLSIKNRYTADGELIIQDNYRDINGTAGLTFE